MRAIVTGGFGGIGSAISRTLVECRAQVIATHLNEEEIQPIPGVESAVLDLASYESIQSFASYIHDDYGKIDVLINNAGVNVWKDFTEQSRIEIETQIAVNLTGAIQLTQLLLPNITDCIINIGSSAGRRGDKHHVPYCATKFGIRGMTQALANEYPSLRIYTINPDTTRSEMSHFQGRDPQDVANIVLDAIQNRFQILSGSDIDVWNPPNKNNFN